MKSPMEGNGKVTANQKKRIVAVLYPGMVALDVVGPLEAFKYVSNLMGDHIGYDVDYVGLVDGPIEGMSGLKFIADHLYSEYSRSTDILLIPGMKLEDYRYRNEAFFEWLRAQASRSKKLVSICTGAYVFAEANLLNGVKVATHWAHSDIIRGAFPDVTVCEDRIYMNDGNVYSSGGLSSGVDLALSIIAEDFGKPVAVKIAKRMVVYMHRQGSQAQYSELLAAQSKANRFAGVIDWIEDNLSRDITISQLSSMCGMSERNFRRSFKAELNISPIKYVKRRRLEYSKHLLEGTDMPLGTLAKMVGFISVDGYSKAFKDTFSIGPTDYRNRFGGTTTA